MNSRRRQSGKSTREMSGKRYKSRVWFLVLIVAAAVLILVLIFNSKVLGISGLGLLGLLVLVRLVVDFGDARSSRMMKEERRAIRGAQAEEKVGMILDELGDNYLVLHDISSPYGNIDHLVLTAQGGVFLIETKAHGGRVAVTNGHLLVNGHEPEKDFIAQALNNTYWLRDAVQEVMHVKPWISPVVAFTNAFVERGAPVKGVSVISAKYLPTLLSRPNSGSRNLGVWEQREKIAEALYNPTSAV